MVPYIVRRLLQAVIILFVLSVVVFVFMQLAPGDPVLIRCPLPCPEERYQAIREEMGLNDPYVVQYFSWGRQLFTGDLGIDFDKRSVADELQRRLPVTMELLIITVLTVVAVGIPFGVISAVYRNSAADYGARLVAILGLAVPSFWLATLVLLIPSQVWHYAPPLAHAVSFFDNPWDNLRQFVPPALVLGAISTASVMRLTRSSMLEVMRQDYVRTARSKGLRERVVIGRHALRNSLVPVVTVLGLEIIGLLGGAVIVESIFNLQGMGLYFFRAVRSNDFIVVQTLTLYTGAVVILVNLLVDIIYAWLDPRIRYS